MLQQQMQQQYAPASVAPVAPVAAAPAPAPVVNLDMIPGAYTRLHHIDNRPLPAYSMDWLTNLKISVVRNVFLTTIKSTTDLRYFRVSWDIYRAD